MALLNYAPPMEPYLEILYQDESLLVLNKPSGLLSVPGKQAQHKDSLQLRVQRVFPSATVVHRLDMATSGLMLMPLSKPIHKALGQQFEQRKVKKTYFARVSGCPESSAGEVKLPLICDWPNRPKQKVDLDNGKPAETHWKIIDSDDSEALMELKPVTGRSHQLRVHMMSIGHAILGDRLYASDIGKAAASRLQLHAASIQFRHPVSNEWVTFNSSCPFSLGVESRAC